jgi:glutathione S-transferase
MNRLITIPISHYCERARWALDFAGVPYVEEQHLQGLHLPYALRAGQNRTLPILVTDREGALADSALVVEFAHRNARPERGLYPEDPALRAEVEALEREFAGPLGVEGRRVMYYFLFRWGRGALTFNGADAPRWERGFFRAALPIMTHALRRHLGVNERSMFRGRAIVQDVFDRVAERLSDGRRYLVADRFTAADLTFATMAAAATCPPDYAVQLPSMAELPDEARQYFEHFRSLPAGRFALRMFAEHRRDFASD